eukprot:5253369-Amphidinium_carterae.1
MLVCHDFACQSDAWLDPTALQLSQCHLEPGGHHWCSGAMLDDICQSDLRSLQVRKHRLAHIESQTYDEMPLEVTLRESPGVACNELAMMSKVMDGKVNVVQTEKGQVAIAKSMQSQSSFAIALVRALL